MADNIGKEHNISWNQTMIRIKDPKITVPFYQKNFGMRLFSTFDFDGFSLFFLDSPKPGEENTLAPGTPESMAYLMDMPGTALKLTHNHGTENDENFRLDTGNYGKNKRFGHIAFNCNDIHEAVAHLEKNGVKFLKRPEDGDMNNFAFALDPDGYRIEIMGRGSSFPHPEVKFNLSQTMIRVSNPEKSVAFYCGHLNMKLITVRKFPKFDVYVLAHIADGNMPKDTDPAKLEDYYKSLWYPVLEFVHNHPGTTDQIVDTKNKSCVCKSEKCICKADSCLCKDECICVDGFGHIGMLIDDVEGACKKLLAKGVTFRKLWNEGNMQKLAFANDPDGYTVSLLDRKAFS